MKQLLLFLVFILFLSCKKENDNGKYTDAGKTQFDWLVGDWIRNNDKDGKKTFESWIKKSSSEYIGVSYTLLNSDTIWKENVKLSKLDTTWCFAVKGKEDKNPTLFMLSKIDDTSFVFENRNNSFPKIIQYQKNGDKFKAIVSGDDMTIRFEFERKKKN